MEPSRCPLRMEFPSGPGTHIYAPVCVYTCGTVYLHAYTGTLYYAYIMLFASFDISLVYVFIWSYIYVYIHVPVYRYMTACNSVSLYTVIHS